MSQLLGPHSLQGAAKAWILGKNFQNFRRYSAALLRWVARTILRGGARLLNHILFKEAYSGMIYDVKSSLARHTDRQTDGEFCGNVAFHAALCNSVASHGKNEL